MLTSERFQELVPQHVESLHETSPEGNNEAYDKICLEYDVDPEVISFVQSAWAEVFGPDMGSHMAGAYLSGFFIALWCVREGHIYGDQA